MVKIETARLVLRRFLPEDGDALFDYLSDADVVKYEPYDVLSKEQCRQEAIRRSETPAFWAVCLKENDKLIGNVYFEQQQPPEDLAWELGYVFNKRYQGQGYATESCRAILDYAIKFLQARRVIAACNPLNTASWRLLERLRLRREGHLLKNVYFHRDSLGNPLWQDTYVYAILAVEWDTLTK